MKYIFLAGAPGSKWSSVSNDLRNFCDVNTTDVGHGTYTKPGENTPMHTGAYWDPGMGFGQNFDRIPHLSTEELEYEFDKPFSQFNYHPRIIKSHQFSKWLDNIVNRPEWVYNPLVLVQRSPEDCERWWHKAGGWGISYPSYEWYRGQMREEINRQCEGIERFINTYPVTKVYNVRELALTLGMENTTNRQFQDFDVYVYLHPRLCYFKDTWHGKLHSYKYSGLSTLDRIGQGETVLDVGCGENVFKNQLGSRVTGIDPINPAADFRLSIDEFDLHEQYDHVLCYGSINFGNRLDIERQVRKVVQCTKPGGLIHWRLNPGRYDHGNPGQESLNLFNWNNPAIYQMAIRNRCDVEEVLHDSNNRIFSLWRKM